MGGSVGGRDATAAAVDRHGPEVTVFADEHGFLVTRAGVHEGVSRDPVPHIGHPVVRAQINGVPAPGRTFVVTRHVVDVSAETSEDDAVLASEGVDVALGVGGEVDVVHRVLGHEVEGGVGEACGVNQDTRADQGAVLVGRMRRQFIAVRQRTGLTARIVRAAQTGAPLRRVPAEGGVGETLHGTELGGRTTVVDDRADLVRSPIRVVRGVFRPRRVHLVTERRTEHVRTTVGTVDFPEAVTQHVGIASGVAIRIERDRRPVVAATPGTTIPVLDDEGITDTTVPVHVTTGGLVLDQTQSPQLVCLGRDGVVGGGGDLVGFRGTAVPQVAGAAGSRSTIIGVIARSPIDVVRIDQTV